MKNNLLKNEKAQVSAEMILLSGTVILIVLLVSSYVYEINKSLSNSFQSIINKSRTILINEL